MDELLVFRMLSETARAPEEGGLAGDVLFADLPHHSVGLRIPPGHRKLIPLGCSFEAPGFRGRLLSVRERAISEGLHLLSETVIQGEALQALVFNADQTRILVIKHHQEVCELVLEATLARRRKVLAPEIC